MNLESQKEIWQVEVDGRIYEAQLGDLPEWIDEGSLQPEDKIRKGNLRWIEARKVPALIPFFNARANGQPMPIVQTITEPEPLDIAEKPGEVAVTVNTAENIPPTQSQAIIPPKTLNLPAALPGECKNHPSVPVAWICSACNIELCKACPRSYGGNVRICPDCGSMCRSVKETAEMSIRSTVAARSSNEGFGIADLSNALTHPFNFKASLFFGGLMFMFFTIGRSASSMGGMVLIGAAIVCAMLANMLTFGVLANTVTNFTQGKLDADFMPSFEDFSIWDDVVHPFFLSIGVYLSSFGPFFLVAAIGGYMVFSSASDQTKKFNEQVSRIPGTELYSPDRTVQQSQEVKGLLEKVKQHNDRLVAQKQGEVAAADSAAPPATDLAPAQTSDEELADLERSLNNARAGKVESATDAETQYREMFTGLLRIAAPVVVIGLLALLWGLIYFPAACAVAGYSRSFMATVNPIVGIDTMRRLGGTYVKILLMGLVIGLASAVIQGILAAVLSPLALPRVGNIPAIAIGSFIGFYFWVVFFCVIGYALFKSADRLKLYR